MSKNAIAHVLGMFPKNAPVAAKPEPAKPELPAEPKSKRGKGKASNDG